MQVLRSAARPGPDPTGRRPVSLAPLTVLELSPPELVACATDAGYDAVGLRLIRATEEEPLRPTIGETPMIKETRRRLDDSGLQLLDVEVLRLRPETRVRDDAGPLLETGAFLGARNVLVTGNDPDHARLADNFAELCLLAKEFELTPSLEPMPWTDVRDLTEAAAIVRSAPVGSAGLLVDAIHYDRALASSDDLRELSPSWIHYIQICDAVAERPTTLEELRYQGRNARLFPGDGCIDLVGMLQALPRVPVSVEAPVAWRAPAATRAQAALRAARRVVDLADGGRRSMSA